MPILHPPATGPVLLGLMLCLSVACRQRPISNPIETAMAPDQRATLRVRAVQQTPDGQAMGLFPLVTGSRHPMPVREAAVERMLAADPGVFWGAATDQAEAIDDWPMIRDLCNRAAADASADALPMLIRSWARPSTRLSDDERPEPAAVEAILSRPVQPYLMELFFTSPGDVDTRTHTAAWAVLVRTAPDAELRQRLADAPPGDTLIESLRLATPALDRLPADKEEVLRLHSLVAATDYAVWRERYAWREAIGEVTANTALRHLPALDRRDRSRDRWDRRQWLTVITSRLAGQQHVSRGESADGEIVTARRESIADHANQLGIADLIVLDALLDGLGDQPLVSDLFRQADADRADTTTEHGGVLSWGGVDRITATPFEPLFRSHDRVYYAGDDCIHAMHTGLAHYHFHAQEHDNAVWAGPGGGDLGFADRLHANCIVFTFIDANTLNADAYFPGGVIIDLGCVSR